MGELEGKITDILNSPEDMQKILNIARSFTSGDISIPEPEHKESPVPKPIPEPKLEPTPEPEQSPSGFSLDNLEINPEMLKTLGSVMGELTSSSGGGGGGGGGGSMLDTITPFLKTERQAQLKRAFTLAKMAKIALGIFTDSGGSGSGGGGGDV